MADYPTGVEVHNGSIRISFMYRGVRCRETLRGWVVNNANIKKAGNLRAAIVSDIQLGQFDYATRFPESGAVKKFTSTRTAHTWADLVEIWKASKEADISRNTMVRVTAQLRSLSRIIGDETPINKIRHSDIMRYRMELLHGTTFYGNGQRPNRHGRAANTVDDYISLLCQLLRFAHRSKFITDKPFEYVPKLAKDRKKPDPLLRDEYAALVLVNDGQDRNLWQFAINAGLRHGELAALAWEDIDLDKGTVHICRSLTRQNDFVPPKTSAGDRVITLLAPALEALRAQYEITGHLAATEIIFHSREYGKTEQQQRRFVFRSGLSKGVTGKFISCQAIADRWDVCVEKAGIRRRTPYQTRHTFACWALAAGANPSFIASQLGHEDAQMVYRVYSAWIKEFDGEQVDLLNSKLASAPTMPPALKLVK